MGSPRRADRRRTMAHLSRRLSRPDATDADRLATAACSQQLRPARARTPQRRTRPTRARARGARAFRRRMWPLAGRTVLESLRVLDWADQQFGVTCPRVAGGVSMGGDIAVALAGIDERVTRVAAARRHPRLDAPRHVRTRRSPRRARPGRGRPVRAAVLQRVRPHHAPRRLSPRPSHHLPVRAKRPACSPRSRPSFSRLSSASECKSNCSTASTISTPPGRTALHRRRQSLTL